MKSEESYRAQTTLHVDVSGKQRYEHLARIGSQVEADTSHLRPSHPEGSADEKLSLGETIHCVATLGGSMLLSGYIGYKFGLTEPWAKEGVKDVKSLIGYTAMTSALFTASFELPRWAFMCKTRA